TSHNATPSGGMSGRVYALLARVVVRAADELLVVSPDLHPERSQAHRPPARRAVVAAPSHGEQAALADRDSGRRALGVRPSQTVIMSVGRLAPQKAMHRVVEVVVALRARGYDVNGVIVGEGPEREALQHQIEGAQAPVKLLGHRNDVPALLAAADIVVSAALWEGQPVWLQEALALGAAIVATDVGGSRAMIGDGAAWVPGESADDADRTMAQRLTETIAGLLDDDVALVELRAKARAAGARLPTSADATAAALESYRRAAAYHLRPHVD
ncbi:MAG: glycosyltransferase, partial [Ornithinimicrobium sp.]